MYQIALAASKKANPRLTFLSSQSKAKNQFTLSNYQMKGSRNRFLFVERARRHIKMEDII